MNLLGIFNNWSKYKYDQIPVLGSLTSVASVFKKQPFFVVVFFYKITTRPLRREDNKVVSQEAEDHTADLDWVPL